MRPCDARPRPIKRGLGNTLRVSERFSAAYNMQLGQAGVLKTTEGQAFGWYCIDESLWKYSYLTGAWNPLVYM